jgi:transmembrane sensor
MTDARPPIACDIERDPTHLAAAEWFVRLHAREVSIEDTLAWQGWLSQSPHNARAFARIEALSQVLRSASFAAEVSQQELARDKYDASVALKDWKPPRNSVRRPIRLALAAALAAMAFAFTQAFWKETPPRPFQTAVGETRVITLTDGSSIALGGDTRVGVAISQHLRAIELFKGEALFKVAKDLKRPFKVRVGDATIVAIGTAFDVQRGSDRAIVSVTEGRVMVEPVSRFIPMVVLQEFKPKLRAVRLDAGQQTTTGSAGIEEPVQVADPAAATAWQSGRLAFRLEPLRYVLEDVNRYARKPIVLEGDGLGALLITGTVERDNITGWVSSLERAFDLQAKEEPERIVVRER